MPFDGKDIDQYRLSVDLVNDSVRVIDPPRPFAGKVVLEGFRLSDSPERMFGNVLEDFLDFPEGFFVGSFPFLKVALGLWKKRDLITHRR